MRRKILKCSVCHAEKSSRDFYRDIRHVKGYMSACKMCMKVPRHQEVEKRQDKTAFIKEH